MNKKILLVGGIVLALGAIAIPTLQKLRQVEAGVCPLTGATLGDEHLRRKVIANFAKSEQNIVQHQDNEYLPGAIKFGVANEFSDDEIARAVYALKDGHELSDMNFKFRAENQKDSLYREPFVFLTYESGHNLTTTASRTASWEIRRIEGTKEQLGDFQPNWSQKLNGFGNNYFEITSRQFLYACCLGPNAEGSPIRKSVPIVLKREGEPGAVIAGPVSAKVAAVSNCGDILTYRDSGGFHRIKWIKGE